MHKSRLVASWEFEMLFGLTSPQCQAFETYF